MTDDPTAEAERLLARITPGPWAWESTAEKSNEFAVGQAFRADGTPIDGRITSSDDWVEDVVIRHTVGMNETGHANFADAEAISALPRLLSALVDQVRELRAQVEWQPIATAPKDVTVLVHDDGYVGRAMRLESGWLDVEIGDSYFDPPPTEWIPLPEPPSRASDPPE